MEQASTNVTTVASGAEEMSVTIGEIAKNAETGKKITDQAVLQGKSTAQRINELGQAAQKIGKVVGFVNRLTDENREKVLIFDDSTYDRSRSKAVELLAWIFDHNSRQRLKGFKLLTLGWSDGASFLPLDFILCSSAKANKRLQDIKEDLDKRTLWIQTQAGGHH